MSSIDTMIELSNRTLTDFTSKIIGSALINLLPMQKNKLWNVLVSGGGRKNKTLIDKIKKMTLKKVKIQPIDDYGVNGDFVESQAFAFLAIRSFLGLRRLLLIV